MQDILGGLIATVLISFLGKLVEWLRPNALSALRRANPWFILAVIFIVTTLALLSPVGESIKVLILSNTDVFLGSIVFLLVLYILIRERQIAKVALTDKVHLQDTITIKKTPAIPTYKPFPLDLNTPGPADWEYDHSDAPKGTLSFDAVAFNLPKGRQGPRGISIGPSRSNQPSEREIHAGVQGVHAILVLLSARNAHREQENIKFENKKIGEISLVFDDNSIQVTPLVLGHNIREWSYKRELYRVVDSLNPKSGVTQIWEAPDGHFTIDMLRINVEKAPRSLKKVVVRAKFENDVKLSYTDFPVIQISAITCLAEEPDL